MRMISPVRGRGRRGKAAATATVLALAGVALIAYAAASQLSAPSPPPSAAGTIDSAVSLASLSPAFSSPAASAAARAAARPSPVPPPGAIPTAITIPAIFVHSTLIRLGKNPDGTLQVPPLASNLAGWYTGSVRPGQVGSAVIAGHVDSYRGPDIFFRLGQLRPGDTITVTRADRSTAVFTVQGVRQYPKSDFPTLAVYGYSAYPALRLITCGGQFDDATRSYVSDIVVFARLSKIIPRGTS